jgi:uncharacterized membrane protein (UPF0136 family)
MPDTIEHGYFETLSVTCLFTAFYEILFWGTPLQFMIFHPAPLMQALLVYALLLLVFSSRSFPSRVRYFLPMMLCNFIDIYSRLRENFCLSFEGKE